jgi:hypothetical protein
MQDVFQRVTATPVYGVIITTGVRLGLGLDVPDRVSDELLIASVQKAACADPLFVSCTASLVFNHSSSSVRNVTIFRQLPATAQTFQNTSQSRRLNGAWTDVLSSSLQNTDDEAEPSHLLQYPPRSRRQLAVSGAFDATSISFLLAAVSADLKNSTDDLNASISLCAGCSAVQKFTADVSIVVQASPAQIAAAVAIARPEDVAADLTGRLGGCVECGAISASQPPSAPPLTPPIPSLPPPTGRNGAL